MIISCTAAISPAKAICWAYGEPTVPACNIKQILRKQSCTFSPNATDEDASSAPNLTCPFVINDIAFKLNYMFRQVW